jgi:hypothetical protein
MRRRRERSGSCGEEPGRLCRGHGVTADDLRECAGPTLFVLSGIDPAFNQADIRVRLIAFLAELAFLNQWARKGYVMRRPATLIGPGFPRGLAVGSPVLEGSVGFPPRPRGARISWHSSRARHGLGHERVRPASHHSVGPWMRPDSPAGQTLSEDDLVRLQHLVPVVEEPQASVGAPERADLRAIGNANTTQCHRAESAF